MCEKLSPVTVGPSAWSTKKIKISILKLFKNCFSWKETCTQFLSLPSGVKASYEVSSLGRYVFGSEISYNKAPPRLPGLAC